MNIRSSNTNVDDAQAALQLGERALAQLALQVRAAQIEARKAELELILEQARHGDFAPLQQWLKVHGQHVPTDAPRHTSGTRYVDPTPMDWDVFRQLAIERLRRRQLSPANKAQQRFAQPTSEISRLRVEGDVQISPAEPSNRNFITDVRLDGAHSGQGSGTVLEARQTAEAAEPTLDDGLSEMYPVPLSAESTEEVEQYENREEVRSAPSEPVGNTPESVSPELLAELKLDEQALAEGQNVVRRGRWRGAVISTAFHIVLLIVLAAMTLDSPVKDGLLSLVASDTSSSAEVDSFELTQELDVQEPVAEPVEATTPTTQPNLAEALPSLNESLSDALSQTVANANSTDSKSTMMAAKANASKEMVSFYGAESSGNSFCFVLDGSGSMRGGPWEAARIELLRSIGSLKPIQKFYIIFFNNEVMAITEPGKNQPARAPLYATPENIAHAKRWLDTLQVMTGEPPMKAMETALQVECDCIYFLADGEMSDSIAKKLLETLRKHNRANDIIDGEVVLVPIHTIAYYSDKGLDIMRKIAEENRGQFKHFSKPKTSRNK